MRTICAASSHVQYAKLTSEEAGKCNMFIEILGCAAQRNRSVENMLELFCDMNLEMQRTGNFSTSVGKEQLLKLVAQNNIILVGFCAFT